MARQPDDILDELLVLRAQGGDLEALSQLVLRWQGRLRRHAQQITARHDVADDVAQEAWLDIIRGLRRLNDPGLFRGWAYRIVHNKSVDWVRRQARNRRLTEAIKKDSPDTSASHKMPDDPVAGTSELKAAIEALNPEQQVCMGAVSMMKIWYWMEMQRISVTREIKRLELQVACLASRQSNIKGEA